MKKKLIIFTTLMAIMVLSAGCGASSMNKPASTSQPKAGQSTVGDNFLTNLLLKNF